MSPRTGRPTDNPKGVSMHVRLDSAYLFTSITYYYRIIIPFMEINVNMK